MSIHQKYKYVCLSPASTNLAMTDFRASGDDYNHLNVQFFLKSWSYENETSESVMPKTD